MLRPLYFVLGLVFVLLAIIGALLPVMPSTVFVILAAWCFTHSSPRLEAWLLRHGTFGPLIRAWRQDRAIPRRGKVMACIGIATGFVLFWLGAHPDWILLAIVAVLMAACAAYILSRPEPLPTR